MVLGKRKYELYATDLETSKAYSELIRKSVEKKGGWRGEQALRTGVDGVRYFDCVMDEIYDKKGYFQSYLTVHFDITDKKRVEKRSITDELTGVYNRYKLNEALLQSIQKATV